VTTLLLIRHGHTDTAGKVLTGQGRGVHLNEHGRRQAEALVTRLEGVPLAAIYSSPLERCRETAAPLARARKLSVHVRRPLLEVDYGDWSGRSIASLRRMKLWRVVQQTPSAMRFPGGETLVGVQARVVEELDALAAAHPTGTIAVVSHADVVRLAVMHYGAIHLDELQRIVVDPASVSVVEVGEYGARILTLNNTDRVPV
jgi:probable phosphoglycerate mutase